MVMVVVMAMVMAVVMAMVMVMDKGTVITRGGTVTAAASFHVGR